MLLPIALVQVQEEQSDRVSAIYRFPASEATEKRVSRIMLEDHYDTYCIEPAPPPAINAMMNGKIKNIAANKIDTPANLKWRNATMAYVLGKISPKAWISRTKNLGETIHFLSTPKTGELRALSGNDSATSVFAELFLLSNPGRPCLTNTDVWLTRELPDAGRLQSWVLAMHDYLGPMLQYRHDSPAIANGKIEIVRADPVPGLLHFLIKGKPKTLHFYFNNSSRTVPLKGIAMEKMTINRGFDVDDKNQMSLRSHGNFIVEG